MNLSETTQPDSTQINADDLIGNSITVTIQAVRAGTSEQPVNVDLLEYPGRAYRPSKSMRRVMVSAWGPESSTYVGRQLTLFRNPEIMFGRDKVGGIEIEAMSDLPGNKPLSVALTVARGKRKPFVVKPLAAAPKPPDTPHLDAVLAAFDAAGVAGDMRLGYCTQLLKRQIASPANLTPADAATVIDALKADAAPPEDPWAGGEA